MSKNSHAKRDSLIAAGYVTALRCAHAYANSTGQEYDDCRGVAMLAVTQLAAKYDGRGEFTAYAAKGIRWALLDKARNESWQKRGSLQRGEKRVMQLPMSALRDGESARALENIGAVDPRFAEIDSRDKTQRLLQFIPAGRPRVIVWRHVIAGQTFKVIGLKLGICESHAVGIYHAALDAARPGIIAATRCAEIPFVPMELLRRRRILPRKLPISTRSTVQRLD